MYLVNTVVGHPTLRISKFPLPGDPVMAMLHRVIIDVDSGKVTRLQMEPDFHRATLGDNISMSDYNWSPDGSKLALASVSRDHKHVWLPRRRHRPPARCARCSTRRWRPSSSRAPAGRCSGRRTRSSGTRERDNWGQLYLYDLQTGKLKNQITTGEGPVMQIARGRRKTRTLWYGANGREKGQDPYFLHFYRIGLDGEGAAVSLTPDDGTHTVQISTVRQVPDRHLLEAGRRRRSSRCATATARW